jgi:hypothetical protein
MLLLLSLVLIAMESVLLLLQLLQLFFVVSLLEILRA